MRFDHRFEEVVLQRTIHSIQLTFIKKALKAAQQVGLLVREFRVDPSTGTVTVFSGSPRDEYPLKTAVRHD